MAKYRKVKVKEFRTEINYTVAYWTEGNSYTTWKEFKCDGTSNSKGYYTNIPDPNGYSYDEFIAKLSVKESAKVKEWINDYLDGVEYKDGKKRKLIAMNREVKQYWFKETLYEPVESNVLLLEDKR